VRRRQKKREHCSTTLARWKGPASHPQYEYVCPRSCRSSRRHQTQDSSRVNGHPTYHFGLLVVSRPREQVRGDEEKEQSTRKKKQTAMIVGGTFAD